MPDPIDWLAGQLDRLPAPERPRHHNPRPAGIPRPGSGTDVTLRFLQRSPQRWFFHSELVLALGRSKGETDWALQYLTMQGQIEAVHVVIPGRKAVYRYKLKALAP